MRSTFKHCFRSTPFNSTQLNSNQIKSNQFIWAQFNSIQCNSQKVHYFCAIYKILSIIKIIFHNAWYRRNIIIMIIIIIIALNVILKRIFYFSFFILPEGKRVFQRVPRLHPIYSVPHNSLQQPWDYCILNDNQQLHHAFQLKITEWRDVR